MISKPKPTKQPKQKKVPAAKRVKILRKQVEEMVKMLISWRDGQECSFRSMPGVSCGNGMMWNHVIRQSASPILALNLGNVVWGCGSHNFAEKHGDATTQIWYERTFGSTAWDDLRAAQSFYKGKNYHEADLEEMLAHYEELYQNRFYVDTDLKSLVRSGYYGEIVKSAWVKDGRI